MKIVLDSDSRATAAGAYHKGSKIAPKITHDLVFQHISEVLKSIWTQRLLVFYLQKPYY